MDNKIYSYKSPAGMFVIKYNMSLKRWDLGMGNEVYGNYHSAEQAADDVYCHSTGCNKWDMLDGKLNNVPSHLAEWEFVNLFHG